MITSTANQQVKDVQKLQKSAKFRARRGLFVVEGWRLFLEMPQRLVECLYFKEEDLNKVPEGLRAKGTVVSAQVLKAMSHEVSPQGILALIKMPVVDKGAKPVDNPLMIALDCVQDPGNLGTIIRTAEAAGVNRILLSKGTVDLYNPKVVKATMGAICRMTIEENVDLPAFIKEQKEVGVAFYAAHLKGEHHHFQADYRGGTCFLMGNEGNGLRDEVANLATSYIKIPMAEDAESLNVAMATGILVYEALRQRLEGL